MGCNDSKTMKQDVYGSRTQRVSRVNPKSYSNDGERQEKQKAGQNASRKVSQLTPFYENLESMYTGSKGDQRQIERFINTIEEHVSEIYNSISKQTLQDMNHEEIHAEQSKTIISEQILCLNLNILKVIGRKNNYEYKKQTFTKLNEFQKSLVGYLKMKYPRGTQTFVSGDLNSLFKQFNRTNDLDYDMLKNYHIYFGEADDNKIIRRIKQFINKIMDQLQVYFPKYEKLMQEEAFVIKNQKGEKISLNYKIGRKISENVSKYDFVDSDVLEINNPQIFRVFIKWMEDLQETIKNTRDKISKKDSFKCFIRQKQDEGGQKKVQFDYINEYEYQNIVDTVISRIENIRPSFDERNKELISEMGQFNERLLKILNRINPVQKYVPMKEVQVIKYSSFNAKFVAYILAEKLVFAIKKLIQVGKTFVSENMMKLDLIKFRVTDLMRCQVTGNKKEIIEIYKNFKNLEAKGQIKIVKIKNRLSTPLNDAMIMYLIKGSFIICEAQLILSEAGSKVDKRGKNTQLINHYFYELERSPYGILAEVAVLLAYKDSKMGYENHITFEQSKADIENCRRIHREKVVQSQQQNTPFICSKCSCFYSKSQNLFKFYQCKACNLSICSKCILSKNPELETSFIMRDIYRELQQKISRAQKENRQKQSTTSKKSGALKHLNKKISPKSILSVFSDEKLKLKQLFGDKLQVRGSKLMALLDQKKDSYNKKNAMYFMIANFHKGEADFKVYRYENSYKEIQNVYDSKDRYDENTNFNYSQYDLLFYVQNDDSQVKSDSPIDKHLFIFLTQKQLENKMKQIEKLKADGKIKKQEKYQIIAYSIRSSPTNQQIVFDYSPIKNKDEETVVRGGQYDDEDWQGEEKKVFKYPSLKVYAEKFPSLKSAQSTMQFDDLGIQTQHLVFFREIDWRDNIKQLKLMKNRITDVTDVLMNCSKLQRIYFNDNFVTELIFKKDLPNLNILNGAMNQITKIGGLGFVRNLKKLLLPDNRLSDFPQCNELSKLNILNLKKNKFLNFKNILNSNLPQLQHLIISEQNTYDIEQEESQQKGQNNGLFGFFGNESEYQNYIQIKFPQLKYFQSQNNQRLLQEKQLQFYSENLQKISLDRCYIEKLTFCKTICIENVKYLNLQGNKIQQFTFMELKQKQYRMMNDSQLSGQQQVKQKIFHNDTLQELNLSQNEIEYLPILKFSALKKLSLEYNRIKDMRPLSKSKMPELQYLNIGGNAMPQMCPLNFAKLKQLCIAQIPDFQNVNEIFKPTSQLGSLEKLDAYSCGKIGFKFDVNPKNNSLQKIKEINFSSNEFIFDQTSQQSFEISTLQYLNLSNCTFNQFPVLIVDKLKELDITYMMVKSLKNLELCKMDSIETLTLNGTLENFSNEQSQITNTQSGTKNTSVNQDYGKYFSCQLKLKSLKELDLTNSNLMSVRGLQTSTLPKLQKIYMGVMKIRDEKFPALKFPSLKTVDAPSGTIKNLDSILTSSLTKLQEINFQNNEITTFSDAVLSNFVNLKNINLSNNKLTKFTCSKNLDKLTKLDLDYNQLTNYPRIKAKNLTRLQLEGNNTITDISQLQNCDIPSIEQISIDGCDLSKSALPVFNMPNLQKIRFVNCKLNNVNNLASSYIPEIKQISLEGNEIQNFPILKFKKLTTISLQRNPLNNIEFLMQSQLQSLINLNLSQTKIPVIPKNLQFTNLKNLSLNNINIGQLPQLQLPELQVIELQSAQLTDIDDFAMGDYPNVVTLYLNFNKLTKIPQLFMESLQQALFEDNLINNVDQFSQSYCPKLLLLSFFNNKLEYAPDIKFTSLESYYISGNPIQELSGFYEAEYPQLTLIAAENCKIKYVEKLPPMMKLTQILIDHNQLQQIDWLFSHPLSCPNLEYFDATANKITKIPSNLDYLNKISTFNLYQNPLKKIDGIMYSTVVIPGIHNVSLTLDLEDDQFTKMKQKLTQKNSFIRVGKYIPQ